MNCREFMERLLDYVAGELAPEEDEQVQQHLDVCRPCLHLTETYRLTIQIVRRLPPADMPPAAAQRLQGALCKQFSSTKDTKGHEEA